MEPRKPNVNTRVWNLRDKPEKIQSHEKRYDQRDQKYPKVDDFKDLPEEIKEGYKTIAAEVREQFPEAKIFIYGSRKNGNFKDDSDWDIVIQVEAEEQIEQYEKLKFTLPVDIHFRVNDEGPKNNKLIIPDPDGKNNRKKTR